MSPPAAEIVRLTNVERAKVGCPALKIDSRLQAAAQAHSVDMALNSYFDHFSPSGTSPVQRAQAAGFPSNQVSENIAAGSATAAQTMALWMSDAPHSANILQCATNLIGVGYATGGRYGTLWTQDFGKL